MAKERSVIQRYSHGDIISMYIYGEVTEPRNYIQELETIRNARDTDTIIMYYNTSGGNLDTAVSFISAMSASNAHIVGVIDGLCASAGSLMFLYSDEYEINKGGHMLIHAYSSWISGKRNEVLAQVAFSSGLNENLFKDIYLGFLTEEEITRVNAGHDIWLAADEIGKRCITLLELRQSSMVDASSDEIENNED